MSYTLPPDLVELVNRHMKRGGYQSQDEVLRAALAALDESHKEKVIVDPVVVAGVRKGLAEIEAGLGISFDKFDAELRAKFGVTDDA